MKNTKLIILASIAIITVCTCAVLAVNTRIFDSMFYRRPSGHALVLESVNRDVLMNEILDYVVVDSNRSDYVDAVRCIDSSQLEKTFSNLGYQSIAIDNIIW